MMILPRDEFYLGTCSTCAWFEEYDKTPFKAQRETVRHATRRAGHRVVLLNMTRLEVVKLYVYTPMEPVTEPPY